MILTFQIIMVLIILLFSLGIVAEKDNEKQSKFVAILLASIFATVFTFYI